MTCLEAACADGQDYEGRASVWLAVPGAMAQAPEGSAPAPSPERASVNIVSQQERERRARLEEQSRLDEAYARQLSLAEECGVPDSDQFVVELLQRGIENIFNEVVRNRLEAFDDVLRQQMESIGAAQPPQAGTDAAQRQREAERVRESIEARRQREAESAENRRRLVAEAMAARTQREMERQRGTVDHARREEEEQRRKATEEQLTQTALYSRVLPAGSGGMTGTGLWRCRCGVIVERAIGYNHLTCSCFIHV